MKGLGLGLLLIAVMGLAPMGAGAVTFRGAPSPTPTSVPIVERANSRVAATSTPSPTPTAVPNTGQTRLRQVGATPTPKTSGAGTTPVIVVTGIGGLDVSRIGQETWLNPQPEPPLPNTIQIRKMGNVPAAITSAQEVTVGKLNYAFSKNQIKPVGGITQETREGKKVFAATVKVPAKLFGLIPITMKEKVTLGEDGKVVVSNKPWYAKVSREQVDLAAKLATLPNLVVKNVRLEPANYGAGDKVKVVATIANEGMGLAIGFPDMINNTGGPTEVLRWMDEGDIAYSWYPIAVYLESGQTEERGDFYINQVTCGENMKYEIANSDTSHIEETTKEDNAMQFKLECSK